MERFLFYQESQKSNQAGFTLVELLLYLTLLGVVVLLISSLFTTFLRQRTKNNVVAEVEQQALQVMQAFTQTMRNASSITSPTPGQNADALTISVPTAGLSPTTFNLSGQMLQITEGAGSPAALTNSKVTVSGLSFQNLSRPGTEGTVRMEFTLTRLEQSPRAEFNYNQTFYASASLR